MWADYIDMEEGNNNIIIYLLYSLEILKILIGYYLIYMVNGSRFIS